MLSEQELIRVTGGCRYWKERPDNLTLSALIRERIDTRIHRAGIRLYVTKTYYRLVREDSSAAHNPLLEDNYVATFRARDDQIDILNRLKGRP